MIHYIVYGFDGMGVVVMREIGYYVQGMAEMLIVMLLILVAKGWTIVRKKITAQGRVKIASYMTIYGWAYVAAQLYRKWTYESAEFYSMYETTAGITLSFLRLGLLGWFWHALYTTRLNFPAKHGFYNKFGVVFTVYIGMLPLMAFVSTQYDEIRRQIFMEAWQVALTFYAQASAPPPPPEQMRARESDLTRARASHPRSSSCSSCTIRWIPTTGASRSTCRRRRLSGSSRKLRAPQSSHQI